MYMSGSFVSTLAMPSCCMQPSPESKVEIVCTPVKDSGGYRLPGMCRLHFHVCNKVTLLASMPLHHLSPSPIILLEVLLRRWV